MVDHRDRATLRGRARFTRRAQLAEAELTGERRIRLLEPERDDLVEQDLGHHVRILDQTRPAVVYESREPVWARRRSRSGRARAVQVAGDRLAVVSEMAGDRRDRPAPLAERVSVHIILLCEHGTGLPLMPAGRRRPPAWKGAPPHRWTPQVRNFSEQN